MDRIETEKSYPQKVEVTNDINAVVESSPDNPLNVDLPSYLLTSSGSVKALRVNDISNHSNETYVRPYTASTYNLHISSVQVVNANVGTVFPVDLTVYNLGSSAVLTNVSAVYGSYSFRYPSASSIVIFYETINSSGSVDASSYSAND